MGSFEISATNPFGFDRHTARHNLRKLVLLRCISLVGQVATIGVVHLGFGIAVPLSALAIVVGVLALANLLTALRLREPWPVTDRELFAQLLIDILAMAAALDLTGGETNPFSGFLLLPLTISAVILPLRYTWAVAATVVGCYSFLVFSSVHLGTAHYDGDWIRLLEYGAWVNYVVIAILLSYFLTSLVETVRQQEQLLLQAKQRAYADECVVRVGAVVAGAAHEIASPLTALSMLVQHVRKHRVQGAELEESLATMGEQVESLRATLGEMMAYSHRSLEDSDERVSIDAWCLALVDKWRAMRPRARLLVDVRQDAPAFVVRPDVSIGHAVLNLLSNAADVSPERVELHCEWDDAELRIRVSDRGPGFPDGSFEALGKPFLTTKGERGCGLGLVLVKTAVQRLGGTLQFRNRASGGAQVDLHLPLGSLSAVSASTRADAQLPQWSKAVRA